MVGSAERGDTVVCVRNSLVDLVHSNDVSIGDQVWLKFKNLQGVLMEFSYIPPCDSPYYLLASFAAIQEKLFSSNMTNGFVIIGDMNCRFGSLVKDNWTYFFGKDYLYTRDGVHLSGEGTGALAWNLQRDLGSHSFLRRM